MFNKKTLVQEVMSSPVRFIAADEPLSRMDAIFTMENFHHLIVVDKEGDLKGIVSQDDCKYALEQIASNSSEAGNSKQGLDHWPVERIMTQHLTCLHVGDDVAKAAAYFLKNEFHALPILDDNEKIVGIVTSHDLLKYAYQ